MNCSEAKVNPECERPVSRVYASFPTLKHCPAKYLSCSRNYIMKEEYTVRRSISRTWDMAKLHHIIIVVFVASIA